MSNRQYDSIVFFFINIINHTNTILFIHFFCICPRIINGNIFTRGKDFNMRWVAAMVAEVHRILQRGGIFLYPRDNRDPAKPGKLRLLYEANPMSMIMENAGGASTNGHTPILDIVPEKIHQRVAVMLGAREEVDLVTSYHKA